MRSSAVQTVAIPEIQDDNKPSSPPTTASSRPADLGDEVDSPEATKLPVRLAVSLLQNRRGEIDINPPISGSLDDPQFSVGGIIDTSHLNVFTKAITSPFALISSLFGGGEELSYVEFDYGYSTISARR